MYLSRPLITKTRHSINNEMNKVSGSGTSRRSETMEEAVCSSNAVASTNRNDSDNVSESKI